MHKHNCKEQERKPHPRDLASSLVARAPKKKCWKIDRSMATSDKYDRQLRLWGVNGQRALSQTNLLLLNAGPTGSEALKNLVLPGLGQFTIVDGEVVTPADRGNNFFVGKESVGHPRAKVCVWRLNIFT